MKFSANWLREIIDPKISNQELIQQLTMAGLEVESINSAVAKFSKVFTAKVVDVIQHPNAERLKVCTVKYNNQLLEIVCGDPTVSTQTIGSIVALATNGASLQDGNIKIKNSKLRGIESHGMLCSRKELALTDLGCGIWILPEGTPLDVDLYEYLNLEDEIIELSITPNRGDCLSLRGIAREVAVINNLKFLDLTDKINNINNQIKNPITIDINIPDNKLCPRYTGRVITNLNPQATTPIWMQEKLRRSGVKTIYPLVDVTNYVMLELGQPMHAFDLNTFSDSNKVKIRSADNNEKLVLLDGTELNVNPGDLLITDNNKPIALAGIMGGQATAISGTTCNVFLESAFFTPQAISGRARKYGFVTDSSARYERGVDPSITKAALERATELLLEIMATSETHISEIDEVINTEYLQSEFTNKTIRLRHSRIKRVLGVELESSLVKNILTNLGLKLLENESNQDSYKFSVPSHRFDLNIEEDLLEELARVYGYDNIPAVTPSRDLEITLAQPEVALCTGIRNILTSRGYLEAVNYSFTDNNFQDDFKITDQSPLKLINPISSELSELRQSLCPGLLKTVEYNVNHQAQALKLYEIGKCYYLDSQDNVIEENKLAGVLAGNRNLENWHETSSKADFFDAKGDLEVLFSELGLSGDIKFLPDQLVCSGVHPGQLAAILYNNINIGWVGKLHPEISRKLDIANLSNSIILFELSLEQLKLPSYTCYKDVSKMPAIKRDLAFLFKLNIKVEQIHAVVKDTIGAVLKSLDIFDVYQGTGVPDGYKSIAFSMVLQAQDKTMVDHEIVAIVNKVVDVITNKLAGQLRE